MSLAPFKIGLNASQESLWTSLSRRLMSASSRFVQVLFHHGDMKRLTAFGVKLGGTVGDIESMPFIEALRQFQFRVGVEK